MENRTLLSGSGITAGAAVLGDVGMHSNLKAKGAVGVTNSDVVYQVIVTASIDLGITLSGLKQQDQIHLLFADGSAVNTGWQSAKSTLKISQRLDPGTYYIDVKHGFVAGNTVTADTTKPKVVKVKKYHIKSTAGYSLAVKGNKPDATIAPTAPTAPTTFSAAFSATGAQSEPTISAQLQQQSGFVQYKAFSTGYVLWGANGPSPDDEIQQALGDCYFMSVISTIARVDPGLIEQDIVPESNGHYLVKFQNNGQEVDEQVDNLFPVNANGNTVFAGIGANNALWPAILEKAWCYFRPNSTQADSYDGIQSGLPSESLMAFGSTDATNETTTSYTSASQMLNQIQTYLQAGNLVDVGTIQPPNAPDPLPSGLFTGHAYSVVQVDPGANTIELRNPWGTNTNGSIDGSNGYITISGDQLLQSIDEITHGTVPTVTPNPVINPTPNPTPTPTPTPSPSPTPSNTVQTVANQLGPDSYQDNAGNNYDVYTVTANSAGNIDVSLSASDFTPQLLIAIQNADGTLTVIGSDANSSGGDVADVKFTATAGATYDVGVFTSTTGGSGSYSLTLTGDLGAPKQLSPNASAGSISGVVFNDANADGTQDNGEVGIAGVTVFIDADGTGQYNPADDPSTTTNANGSYSFSNLSPGSYTVYIVTSNGYTQTTPASNGGVSATVTAGQVTSVAAIGEAASSTGSITGNVYNDANGNGSQDGNEAGLSGWYVYLDLNNSGSYANGDPYATTDSNGNFEFQGLSAGTYRVRVYPESGFTTTQGADGYNATITAGQTASGAFFGEEQPTASISGVVYNDANSNGVQDSGEAGLAGWTVYIDLNNTGSYVSGDPTATTDANGVYTFTGVSPGTAYVTRVVPQGGFSTIQGASGWQPTAVAGQAVNGGSFGETQATGALAGTVYDDRNGDGVQEPTEYGLQGWAVYIDLNNQGQYQPGDPYVYTDAYGGYSFAGLAPGTYTVRAAPGTGWFATQGANGYTVTVVPNQTTFSGNFGES